MHLLLEDGPVQTVFTCTRAPVWLRVVVNEETGQADCLDQLDDTPADGERISVYRQTGGRGFACRGPGAGPIIMYRHVPDVDVSRARDNEEWRGMARELEALAEHEV